MMKGYTLSQLLIFFKRQQCIGFQGINFCIEIIEDDELSDADKRETILELLHDFELFTEELLDKRIKLLENEIKMKESGEFVWDVPRMGSVNPTQVFDCIFLNGKVRFEWNLN